MPARRFFLPAARILRCGLALLAAGLIAAAPCAGATAAALRWPDTDLARHAQAWFAQLAGTEADARAFFASHLSPDALAEAGVDARLERRKAMLDRTGPLTALEAIQDDPSHLRVHARAPDGDEPWVEVTGDPAPPHLIRSIRVSMGGPGEGPPPPAGPPLDDAQAVRLIRAALDSSAAAGGFSGAVILAREGRPLLRQAWGLADRDRKIPVTLATRFNIASLGKLITRVALAQLIDAGKLSLADKLSKYLPDWPRADEITVDMLAEHRSGVGDIFNERYEAIDHAKLRHNHDYLQLLRDQPLWFEPGTSQRYSNGGYVLLGEVIAKASGTDYYDYLQQHVYAPAGMNATAAPVEGDGTPDLARGYTGHGGSGGDERDNVATRPGRGSAAGGSYSTVDDFLAFDQALLAGRLCSRERVGWVIEEPRQSPAGPGFGFAGGAPGISTDWTHEGKLTLIVFTNRDPAVTKQALALVRDLFRRLRP